MYLKPITSVQAFVVEAQTTSWQTAEISALGRQGLLPKLDVVLLVNHFLKTQVRLKPTLPQRRPAMVEQLRSVLPRLAGKQQQEYASLLQGTLSFVAMQVGGMPDGAHAPFKEYAVDAVTARMLPVCPSVVLAAPCTGVRSWSLVTTNLPGMCNSGCRTSFFQP